MTYVFFDLANFKRDQKKETQENIMKAVLKLRKATAPKVTRYLDEKVNQEAKEYAQRKYETGNINSGSVRKIEKQYIRKHKRVKRTIERNLNSLTNEGYLERKDNTYTISEKGLHYIRFFIRCFGERPLSDICDNPQFLGSVEEYLQKLVQTFGVYLVYVFLQILRINQINWLNMQEKDEITLSFFENGIPLRKMFELFKDAQKISTIGELRSTLEKQYQQEFKSFQSEWDYLYEGTI